MSWEGYSQNFCQNGHFFHGSAEYGVVPDACSCGASISLQNIVDDTNFENHGVIPPEVLQTLLINAEETATCNMGHVHVTKMAVFRIPSKEELPSLRYYWNGKKHIPLPSRS